MCRWGDVFDKTTEHDRSNWRKNFPIVLGMKKHLSSGLNNTLSREELKLMISLFNPKHFIPVHGEYRHLVAHARLAQQMNVDRENVFILEDGDLLFLTGEFAEVTGNIEPNLISVKGNKILSS